MQYFTIPMKPNFNIVIEKIATSLNNDKFQKNFSEQIVCNFGVHIAHTVGPNCNFSQ